MWTNSFTLPVVHQNDLSNYAGRMPFHRAVVVWKARNHSPVGQWQLGSIRSVPTGLIMDAWKINRSTARKLTSLIPSASRNCHAINSRVVVVVLQDFVALYDWYQLMIYQVWIYQSMVLNLVARQVQHTPASSCSISPEELSYLRGYIQAPVKCRWVSACIEYAMNNLEFVCILQVLFMRMLMTC